jgi:quercetin dioxygenase-like cupin family protein
MADHAVSTRPPLLIPTGPITVRFLVEGSSTRGAMSMFEWDVPAGLRGPAAHSHDGYEETVYALRGSLTWTVEGSPIEVGPGECLVIPRGAVHRFDNPGSETATALAVITPGILGPDYFRDIAAVVARADGGRPDPAAVGAVMRKHGLTPAMAPA